MVNLQEETESKGDSGLDFKLDKDLRVFALASQASGVSVLNRVCDTDVAIPHGLTTPGMCNGASGMDRQPDLKHWECMGSLRNRSGTVNCRL